MRDISAYVTVYVIFVPSVLLPVVICGSLALISTTSAVWGALMTVLYTGTNMYTLWLDKNVDNIEVNQQLQYNMMVLSMIIAGSSVFTLIKSLQPPRTKLFSKRKKNDLF